MARVIRLEVVRGEPDDVGVGEHPRLSFSALLSGDLRLSWAYARSIEKMIMKFLKEPGFWRAALATDR